MKCRNLLFHASIDPHWAIGLIMAARRSGEIVLPLGQRLIIALGPMLITGSIAALGSLFGGYIAVEKRFAAIEQNQTELKLLLANSSQQRLSEIASLRQADSELATRITAIEALQRICGENVAEMRALMRREQLMERNN